MKARTVTADNIAVYCAYDEIVQIDKVIPNPKNPNQHGAEQIAMLAEIIKQAGWRNSITVSTLSGFIVKGHGRLLAAEYGGLTEVPVEYQHYNTEADELADLVADNRLAEMAEMDNAKLADIFRDIDLAEMPTELTGYTADEIAEINAALKNVDEALELDDEPEPTEKQQTVTCPKCGFEFEVNK